MVRAGLVGLSFLISRSEEFGRSRQVLVHAPYRPFFFGCPVCGRIGLGVYRIGLVRAGEGLPGWIGDGARSDWLSWDQLMGLDWIAPHFLNRITLFERFLDPKQFAFLAMACCTVPQNCCPWLFLLKIASWLEPMLLQAKQDFRSIRSFVPAPVSLRFVCPFQFQYARLFYPFCRLLSLPL